MTDSLEQIPTVEPRDRRLFALVSAIVSDALSFVERLISRGHLMRPYDVWATVRWSKAGMPEFSFSESNAPIDYKEAFNPMLALFSSLAKDKEGALDVYKHPVFQQLKDYIRSQPSIVENFFSPDLDEDMFGSSVKTFIEYSIDRYIHTARRTHFDVDKFLPIYNLLEAGSLLNHLPIEIAVPVLLISLSTESYELSDGIFVARMSEPLQLARAIQAHDTHEVNEYLLHQASHALVLTDYVVPNSHNPFFRSYEAETFPLDKIDAFFASLRIVTSVETGYAQILVVPVGWAHSFTADLPPLEGTILRKYPPGLLPVNAFYGADFPRVSDEQLASVRDLFSRIDTIQSSGTPGSERLRLAIKRLNSCFLRETEEDAILDATIGMEILLSDRESQEVTHKLALRLAALSSLVPGYEQQGTTVFRNVKRSIYPYRSAVAHGDESKANKKREIKTETGDAIPALKLATEYLGMAVQAVSSHPEFLEPTVIDERLLLGRATY